MDMAPKSARALPVGRLASTCEPELVPKPTPTNHMGFSYVNMASPFSGLPPIMMILGQVSGVERSGALATQDERLVAIAAAAADVLRRTPYHAVRAGDVAAAVRLPGEHGRSAVWLDNQGRHRRGLVALAAAPARRDVPRRAPPAGPHPDRPRAGAR